VFWSLQNAQHNIDDVLALVSLLRVGAVARGDLSDVHGVNVARSAGDENLLFWDVFGAASFAVLDSKALV
jgi:hypothetical protein